MSAAQARSAKAGDQVRVNYTGTFVDGTVFDSSEGNEPLEFTIGEGNVIAGFDQALIGMQPGETRQVEVPPDQAYGPHVPEMVAEVERKLIPDDHRLQIGGFLEVTLENGDELEVQVIELTAETVTLDANHPLAGKMLHFEIELLDFV
ncbi:MAG: peptidylprolyl isomerase [Deltaproteobacteria bacterium]|jgi:FKBP-type peptidyl-prolyl cis-trans isomerase 2|nr:peptidylprolyl isomerase [Deltaproteobacteria bacterium]